MRSVWVASRISRRKDKSPANRASMAVTNRRAAGTDASKLRKAPRKSVPITAHTSSAVVVQRVIAVLINRARLEFRAEIFNLLNHDNFGNPDTNISNGTVGTITTADDGRNLQLGVRVAW